MRHHVWYAITDLGNLIILVPCVLLIGLLLLLPASTRRLFVVWLIIVALGGTLVATTKVLFMGWRLGIESLDFTGLSGHTTLAFLAWPVAFALLLGQTDSMRAVGAAIGVLLASLVGVSRVEIQAHSVSEVVFGGLLGIALSGLFLVRYGQALKVVVFPRWLALTLVLPLILGYGQVLPTESILGSVARALSGHTFVYTRFDLHSAVLSIPPH